MKTLDSVINLNYKEFVKELKELIKDPKIIALLNAGRVDGYKNDEKIKFSKRNIKSSLLHPTQKQLIFEKSIKWGLIGKDMKATAEILGGGPVLVNGKPIVTLNGKYIIDGHHRWVEAFLINPDSKVIIYDMTIDENPIDVLKIMQLAIASDGNGLPISNPDGSNMITMNKKEFIKKINDNIIDDVVTIFGTNKNAVAKLLSTHLTYLQKFLKPIKSAPDRSLMPQTGKSDNWDKKLQNGDVNYKPPFLKEHLTFERFLKS